MAKSETAMAREQRLAAKLRENLIKRKVQARARREPEREPEADGTVATDDGQAEPRGQT